MHVHYDDVVATADLVLIVQKTSVHQRGEDDGRQALCGAENVLQGFGAVVVMAWVDGGGPPQVDNALTIREDAQLSLGLQAPAKTLLEKLADRLESGRD